MNKILVPVDGSVASKKSSIKAVQIAKENNGEIVFLSIVDFRGKYAYMGYMGDGVDPAYTGDGFNAKILAMLLKNQAEMLDSFTGLLNIEGVKFENKVIEGIPYEEILKYAGENDVDLIIMGRRGFSKVKRFFVGSVTQRVISDAPCPVLVINEGE